MILPSKHIKLSDSLLNIGAIILRNLNSPQTVSALWSKVHSFAEVKTFDRFILGLDFLFMIGIIDFNDGLLQRIKA